MRALKISFVDVFGLPYDGSTLSRRGLGGSESAVIHMSRELAILGFRVTVFCDCDTDDTSPGVYDNVTYRPLCQAETTQTHYDIMIASRSVAPFAPYSLKERFKSFKGLPNTENMAQRAGYKILWMHDTFCDGDDLIEEFCLSGRIHKVFTLSDWHTTYITNCDHGKRRNYEVLKKYIWQTRNGIVKYTDWTDIRNKDSNLFVFNSSVTKGMVPLVENIWPEIKKNIPSAKLKILGGYYKFSNNSVPDEQQTTFMRLCDLANKSPELDIEFTGIVTQQQVAEIMTEASYMLYPALFPETFGISVLEALYYNTPVITNDFGALESIALDNACYKIPYAIAANGLFPNIDMETQCTKFVNQTIQAYSLPYLHQQKQYACNQVNDICSWDTVALQWKQHLFTEFEYFLSKQEYIKATNLNNKVREVFGIVNSDPRALTVRQSQQHHIHVIVCYYNAEPYLEKCLHSILSQDYDNYSLSIIDDASTDNSQEIVNNVISNNFPDTTTSLTVNKENHGAVYNQVRAIKASNPSDIIMIVDGDDWLMADNQIFHRINNLYDQGAEFTYGSCWSLIDDIPLVAQPYPPYIKKAKKYRDYLFNWNMPYTHLRTFKASMIQSASDKTFCDSHGNWYRAGGDTSVFYTAIEAADPDKVICVPEILYVYNDLNPINDYKVNSREQTNTANKILKGSARHGQ